MYFYTSHSSYSASLASARSHRSQVQCKWQPSISQCTLTPFPRRHRGADYRDQYQQAAGDFVGRGDLIDEYRRQADGDDYFERTEQARHRRGDIFQRRKERSVGKQAAGYSLQGHDREQRHGETAEVVPTVVKGFKEKQQHDPEHV